MTGPDLFYENEARANGYVRIAGVDEVGRGPLAGPVTAAAVVLDITRIPPGLNDSKKLSAKIRANVESAILKTAEVSIAHASVAEIDDLNIFHASHLAMTRAVAGLPVPADFALIDGNKIPFGLTIPARAIVKGDAKSVSVAAASIVAKMCRDRIMTALSHEFSGYEWDKNAGYPTKKHLEALENLGITPHHRRSFKPVHNILYQDK